MREKCFQTVRRFSYFLCFSGWCVMVWVINCVDILKIHTNSITLTNNITGVVLKRKLFMFADYVTLVTKGIIWKCLKSMPLKSQNSSPTFTWTFSHTKSGQNQDLAISCGAGVPLQFTFNMFSKGQTNKFQNALRKFLILFNCF